MVGVLGMRDGSRISPGGALSFAHEGRGERTFSKGKGIYFELPPRRNSVNHVGCNAPTASEYGSTRRLGSPGGENASAKTLPTDQFIVLPRQVPHFAGSG